MDCKQTGFVLDFHAMCRVIAVFGCVRSTHSANTKNRIVTNLPVHSRESKTCALKCGWCRVDCKRTGVVFGFPRDAPCCSRFWICAMRPTQRAIAKNHITSNQPFHKKYIRDLGSRRRIGAVQHDALYLIWQG